MTNRSCIHAASGCDYPAGECSGACRSKANAPSQEGPAKDSKRLDWLCANNAELKKWENGDYVVFIKGIGVGVHSDLREAIDRAIHYAFAIRAATAIGETKEE